MTLHLDNFDLTLTPDDDLRDAQHNANEIEAILTAGRDSGHVRVTLYTDGTYSASTLILDGQHRDGDQEAKIQVAIDRELDRPKRSDEEMTEAAVSNFADSLRNESGE